jgi:hypothetical protein
VSLKMKFFRPFFKPAIKSDVDIIAGLKKGLKNFIFKLTRRNPLIVVEILDV